MKREFSSRVQISKSSEVSCRKEAKYTWRAASTEQQVYKIWKSYFSRAMTSKMRRIRNAAKSRSAPPPTWIRREIFEGLWDIWEARKFKYLQEYNCKNRLFDNDGQGVVKNTSGTISIHHRAHKMEIYTSKLKEKKSDQSYLLSTQGSCIYYPELWVQASWGPKNGRCYGFATQSLYQPFLSPSAFSQDA
ncbi:hypothetical protein KSP39_PZI000841 [Platanthera zijinensis]|uniref:Uncharacterized protein n=1 Tax=Platanthera zijinensis TaxID=2320716 RepID=A0AAP0C1Y1_9ASPA